MRPLFLASSDRAPGTYSEVSKTATGETECITGDRILRHGVILVGLTHHTLSINPYQPSGIMEKNGAPRPRPSIVSGVLVLQTNINRWFGI